MSTSFNSDSEARNNRAGEVPWFAVYLKGRRCRCWQISSLFSSLFLTGLGTGIMLSMLLIVLMNCRSDHLLGARLETQYLSSTPSTDTPQEANGAGRSAREIRKDITAFIKNSKQKQDHSLQVAAILDLCRIHHELVTDSRFQTHDQFKGFRARVATRLKSFQSEVKREMKRRKRMRERQVRLAAQARRRQGDVAKPSLPPLPDNNSASEPDLWDLALNESMYEMGGVTGAPSQFFGYLGGSFAPPWDYGPDLVNLIQRTISPSSWLRNGGEGRIEYYRPSMVIVVSASQRVHDQMTDLLRQMRFLTR